MACRPHETWLELHDDDGDGDGELDDSLEDEEDDEDYIDDDDVEVAEEFQALKSVVVVGTQLCRGLLALFLLFFHYHQFCHSLKLSALRAKEARMNWMKRRRRRTTLAPS